MPSSDSYVRSYKDEYKASVKRKGKKALSSDRNKRAKARRKMEKLHGALGSSVVDHVTPLKSGGSNESSNLRVRTRSSNAKHGGEIGDPKKKANGAKKANRTKALKGALSS